jgi:hypothetical protein
MKKLKLGLGALALVLAIGTAVASSANSHPTAACRTTNPKVGSPAECPGADNVACCTIGSTQYFKQS